MVGHGMNFYFFKNRLKEWIFFDISKKIKQAAHENDEELIRAIEFMFEEK